MKHTQWNWEIGSRLCSSCNFLKIKYLWKISYRKGWNRKYFMLTYCIYIALFRLDMTGMTIKKDY